ncbi:hypothetical protein VTO42DRAFT_131 [Malbranchea cinnamomea]
MIGQTHRPLHTSTTYLLQPFYRTLVPLFNGLWTTARFESGCDREKTRGQLDETLPMWMLNDFREAGSRALVAGWCTWLRCSPTLPAQPRLLKLESHER